MQFSNLDHIIQIPDISKNKIVGQYFNIKMNMHNNKQYNLNIIKINKNHKERGKNELKFKKDTKILL